MFNSYNAWMIFVRNSNISSRPKSFSDNIYLITIKEFSQLFFIGNNFVFVIKWHIVVTYETFICKKQLDEIPKARIGFQVFFCDFLNIFFHIFSSQKYA